jgi:hypothetical protein
MATARRLNARVVVRRVLSVPDGPFAPCVRARRAPFARVLFPRRPASPAREARSRARARVSRRRFARVGLKNVEKRPSDRCTNHRRTVYAHDSNTIVFLFFVYLL